MSSNTLPESLRERSERLHVLRQKVLSGLSQITRDAIKTGSVSDFPRVEAPIELGGGWEQEHLRRADSLDIWRRTAKAGSSMPTHSHPGHTQVVIVCRGRVEVAVANQTTEYGAADTFIIPPGKQYSISAVEDAELIVIFYPPIGRSFI